MNCISLNCRGCGRPKTVQEIRPLVEEVKPAVVFLMETRLDRERALGLKRKLGFANGEAVSSDGLSGGILLLWRGVLQWLFRVFPRFTSMCYSLGLI
jgi:hypothetical protein